MKRISITFGITALLAAMALMTTVMRTSAEPVKPNEQAEASALTNYTLFVYEPRESFKLRTDAARSGEYWGSFAAYGEELAKAGVMRGGSAVFPIEQGKAVSVSQGELISREIAFDNDGFALGGYFVIAVADIDKAVEWAARCPAAKTGSVVVRENVPMSPQMIGGSASPESAK